MRYGQRDFVRNESVMMPAWMMTNGRSGFCGTTITGENSRKYHGLLIGCNRSPEERYLVLNKLEEVVVDEEGTYVLATSLYENELKEGYRYQLSFEYESLPKYTYKLKGLKLDKTIALQYGKNTVVIAYKIANGKQACSLKVAPLTTFREPGLCSKLEDLAFYETIEKTKITLVPKQNKGVCIKLWSSKGEISLPENQVTSEMIYEVDGTTGDLNKEPLYIPGVFEVSLLPYEHKTFYIVCTMEAETDIDPAVVIQEEEERISRLKTTFEDSRLLAQYLPIAADQFIVERDSIHSKTILAGYPWFLDWGRDTMIAFNGLLLTTKRFQEAREVLQSFVQFEKNGLIPNMFPAEKGEPLYNTVDASLWFIHASYSYLLYDKGEVGKAFIKEKIYPTLKRIITAYERGTDFSIGKTEDGLLQAGSGLDQVTWMDVRVEELVVTPRHGKPVEINALWYNALMMMRDLSKYFGETIWQHYEAQAQLTKAAFNKVFWNEAEDCLFDVVSEEGPDASLRPNQIWAVSLPYTMLSKERAQAVVYKVWEELYTPFGLRSLSSKHPAYHKQYVGALEERDLAYHQGTVWGFPIGAFLTAYGKVHDYNEEAIAFIDEALKNIEVDLRSQCLGTIAEVFDGEPPHLARGCYAQAWSVGEVLRVYYEDLQGHHKELSFSQKELFNL